jgi:radical SAM-linked protein
MAAGAYRYRITFAKSAEMQYTGHLDLVRAWERMIRRTDLPVVFSRGYHPRPRFTIASALPLGSTAEAEVAEVVLETRLPPEEVRARLEQVSPPGIRVTAVETVELKGPSLQSQVVEAEYTVTLEAGIDRAELERGVKTLLSAERLPRERRGKPYDLRALVESIEVVGGEGDVPRLTMRLAAREGATGRPDEVLNALGLDPLRAQIRRTHLILNTGCGG